MLDRFEVGFGLERDDVGPASFYRLVQAIDRGLGVASYFYLMHAETALARTSAASPSEPCHRVSDDDRFSA
jgi:hypothetical protein